VADARSFRPEDQVVVLRSYLRQRQMLKPATALFFLNSARPLAYNPSGPYPRPRRDGTRVPMACPWCAARLTAGNGVEIAQGKTKVQQS
jgi:hypothetical protein